MHVSLWNLVNLLQVLQWPKRKEVHEFHWVRLEKKKRRKELNHWGLGGGWGCLCVSGIFCEEGPFYTSRAAPRPPQLWGSQPFTLSSQSKETWSHTVWWRLVRVMYCISASFPIKSLFWTLSWRFSVSFVMFRCQPLGGDQTVSLKGLINIFSTWRLITCLHKITPNI